MESPLPAVQGGSWAGARVSARPPRAAPRPRWGWPSCGRGGTGGWRPCPGPGPEGRRSRQHRLYHRHRPLHPVRSEAFNIHIYNSEQITLPGWRGPSRPVSSASSLAVAACRAACNPAVLEAKGARLGSSFSISLCWLAWSSLQEINCF